MKKIKAEICKRDIRIDSQHDQGTQLNTIHYVLCINNLPYNFII